MKQDIRVLFLDGKEVTKPFSNTRVPQTATETIDMHCEVDFSECDPKVRELLERHNYNIAVVEPFNLVEGGVVLKGYDVGRVDMSSTRAILQQINAKGIPILLATSQSQKSLEYWGISPEDYQGHLNKPYRLDELGKAIGNILHQQQLV